MWPFSKLFTRSKVAANANVTTSPFQAIISTALTERGQQEDDMRLDPDFRQPNYVVRMCKALHEQLQVMGQTSVSLASVVMLERTACGHSDYAHKLDLRLNQMVHRGAQ
ncbi:hypothetical protein [Pseudomonas amygdali]|nr:hypothetical protein [Pseudomonas amygdali]KPC17264.1 Uncharacterized protein AC499_0466 [Pseudomonas amygdali pv. lachrymans]KPC18223.1 Uncharacterized protein AC499_1425 [Pseudomonas amygdali pv. lachrymans]RMT05845.1 hypothetical protein ALP54_03727 [Pseudomonas amygdali pv. lachrymans]